MVHDYVREVRADRKHRVLHKTVTTSTERLQTERYVRGITFI
jgi:hypothetical protein